MISYLVCHEFVYEIDLAFSCDFYSFADTDVSVTVAYGCLFDFEQSFFHALLGWHIPACSALLNQITAFPHPLEQAALADVMAVLS